MKIDSTEKKNIAADEEDGFVPLACPKVSLFEIEKLCELDFPDLAAYIASKFFPALKDKIGEHARDAYSRFEDGETVVPIVKLDDGVYVLELWHGPTAAHVDISMLLLPYILPAVKEGEGEVWLALIPQIAYYFSAYCDLCSGGQIDLGDEVDFVTGDAYSAAAGYCAYKMGLPVGKIVCAYSDKAHRGLIENIEPDKDKLKEKIFFKRVAGEESRAAIADYFDEYGYIFDPISACAVYLMDEACEGENPVVILSLSSPHRYAGDCLKAIGERAGKNEAENMRYLEEVTALDIPEVLINSHSMEKISENGIKPKK